MLREQALFSDGSKKGLESIKRRYEERGDVSVCEKLRVLRYHGLELFRISRDILEDHCPDVPKRNNDASIMEVDSSLKDRCVIIENMETLFIIIEAFEGIFTLKVCFERFKKLVIREYPCQVADTRHRPGLHDGARNPGLEPRMKLRTSEAKAHSQVPPIKCPSSGWCMLTRAPLKQLLCLAQRWNARNINRPTARAGEMEWLRPIKSARFLRIPKFEKPNLRESTFTCTKFEIETSPTLKTQTLAANCLVNSTPTLS